ncbi:hypothetical protein JCM10296v2_001783 [Rhodotorula toruloides]
MSRTCRRLRGPALRALLYDPSEHIFEGVDKAAAARQDWGRLCALVALLRAQPHLGQYIQHLDALAEIAYAKFAELKFTWPAEVDGVLVRLLAMSLNLKSVDVFPVKKKGADQMKWLDVLRKLRRLELVIVTDTSPKYTLRHIVFPFLSYRKIPSRVRISIENFQWHGRVLAHHRHASVVGNTSLSITEGGLDDAESWRRLPLSCPKLQHLTLAPPALPLCLSKGLAPSTLQSLTIRASAMLMEHAVENRDLLEKFWIDRYQPFLAALHQLPALEGIQLDLAPFNADVLRALGHVAPALRELVFDGPAWRGAAVRNPETDADILDAISSLNMLRRLEVLTVPDDDEPDVLPATKAYCKTRGIELVIVPEALQEEDGDEEDEDFEGDEERDGDAVALTLRNFWAAELKIRAAIRLPPLILCLEQFDVCSYKLWRSLPLDLSNIRSLTIRFDCTDYTFDTFILPEQLEKLVFEYSLDELPFLRFLDFGFLPVANYRSPMQTLTDYCADRGIEFQWGPAAGPLPGYEEAGDPGEVINPGPLDKQDEVGADIRHPRAILQREPQLGDVDLSDALVEDPFGWTPSSRETTPLGETPFESFLENLSDSSDTSSSPTPYPPSSPEYLPAPLDEPRLASDYEARDTVDEPDEEPWWDWSRPCDFEAADKAWMELEQDVGAGTFPFP